MIHAVFYQPTETVFEMTDDPHHKGLAREAKAIVALALRNGPLEDVHAGSRCPVCDGKPGISRITDDEMKRIMKYAVNRIYALLVLKENEPERYERDIAFGERTTANWDNPE